MIMQISEDASMLSHQLCIFTFSAWWILFRLKLMCVDRGVPQIQSLVDSLIERLHVDTEIHWEHT